MKYKLLIKISIFLFVLYSINIIVFAEQFTYLDKNNNNNIISNDLNILLIDVSTDGDVCVFKINNKIYVIKKGELETIGNTKLWVKDIYAISSKEKNNDVCVALITGVITEKKVAENTTKISKINYTENKINYTQSNKDNNVSLINLSTVEPDIKSGIESAIEPDIELNIEAAVEPIIQKQSLFKQLIFFFKQLFK